MAQKKIMLELSIVEAQHLGRAIADSQDLHESVFGRRNATLTRVAGKLGKAVVAAELAEKKSEEGEDAGAGKPDADAD